MRSIWSIWTCTCKGYLYVSIGFWFREHKVDDKLRGHNSDSIYMYMYCVQPLISSCIRRFVNRETGVSSNVCTNLTVGSWGYSFSASSWLI